LFLGTIVPKKQEMNEAIGWVIHFGRCSLPENEFENHI